MIFRKWTVSNMTDTKEPGVNYGGKINMNHMSIPDSNLGPFGCEINALTE